MDIPDFSRIDSGTQFKIFDRAISDGGFSLPKEDTENRAMVAIMEKIAEETAIALAENCGPCEECGMEAETMEWQEADQNFTCYDCGNVQYGSGNPWPGSGGSNDGKV